MSFIEEFMGTLGPEVTKQLSNNLGINEDSAKQMIPQIAPLILGGLKRQKDERGGEARVDHILNKYGSASVLEDIAGFFSSKARDENPDPKLGGLLGESGVQASNMLSKQFNIDGSIVSKAIPMLAPIILGALTRKRDQGAAGSSGIASLLDQDGDGSILDDVAGFLMRGATGSGSKRGGGILGGLLESLFGSRR